MILAATSDSVLGLVIAATSAISVAAVTGFFAVKAQRQSNKAEANTAAVIATGSEVADALAIAREATAMAARLQKDVTTARKDLAVAQAKLRAALRSQIDGTP